MASTQKQLDVSDIFEHDIGRSPGLWVWEIKNLYPSLIDRGMC